jgi:hypothetical protein
MNNENTRYKTYRVSVAATIEVTVDGDEELAMDYVNTLLVDDGFIVDDMGIDNRTEI